MNDFDIWQKALAKIDLTEAVAPVVRGVMLVEDSQVEMYNKIQKLLNSTGMESCHSYLYNLDPSELSESECQKVCNLYKLGQERGFIEADVEDEEEVKEDVEAVAEIAPATVAPAPAPIAPPTVPLQQNAFTVLYSATRDGMVKTGEAFSNCVNTRSAKADVISKLEKAGYQNISILAIEAGDPDLCGCDNTYCAQKAEVPDYSCESEDEDVKEADCREPLVKAGQAAQVNFSTANSAGQDAVAISSVEPNEDQEDVVDSVNEEDDKKDDKEADTEDKAEEKQDDSKKDDKEADKPEDDKKEEDAEEPDEKLKDDKEDSADAEKAEKKDDEDELSAADKETLKDSYKKAFKAAMKKCKFETSFSELSLEDKVKFFTELSKAWGDKADPSKFMTDKEVDQLEKIVVKQ